MNRRHFLQLSAAPLLAQRGNKPLNFVVILADDTGANAFSCYGATEYRTPNVDALAASGVRFETCYATPLCSPSRVELMTGRYAFRTGWYNLIGRPFTPGDRLDPNEITFADVLKTKGYRTALAGKWQLGDIEKHPSMIHDSGFDEYQAWAWPLRQRYWNPDIIENGKRVPTTLKDYGPDMQADWIDAFIKRNKQRPFLLYHTNVLAHAPFDPTPDPRNPGQRKPGSLKSSVEYLDHLMGRLVKTLEANGLRENTVILFTGDNGTVGDGKAQTTELGVRVPFVASCPGLIPKGKVIQDLIDFSDVMPTLAELAGAELPKNVELDGRSFAPQLLGKKGNPRRWIFSYLQNRRVLRDNRWLLEGDGKFYDVSGGRRKDVTVSTDADVLAARKRFDSILANLPAPKGEAEPREPRRRQRRPA